MNLCEVKIPKGGYVKFVLANNQTASANVVETVVTVLVRDELL